MTTSLLLIGGGALVAADAMLVGQTPTLTNDVWTNRLLAASGMLGMIMGVMRQCREWLNDAKVRAADRKLLADQAAQINEMTDSLRRITALGAERALRIEELTEQVKAADSASQRLTKSVGRAVQENTKTIAAIAQAGVLVIDDDASLATTLRRFLDGRGFRTDSCATLSDARKFLLNRPTHVVLDVNLAGESGFDILKYVRQQKLPTKVALLTGADCETPDFRRTVDAWKPDAVFLKPIRDQDYDALVTFLRDQSAPRAVDTDPDMPVIALPMSKSDSAIRARVDLPPKGTP